MSVCVCVRSLKGLLVLCNTVPLVSYSIIKLVFLTICGYKDINSFITKRQMFCVCVCVCARESGRERERGLLWLTPRCDTHIQSLISSSYFYGSLWLNWVSTRGQGDLRHANAFASGTCRLRGLLSATPLGVEKLLSLYMFWTPTHLHSGEIHMIHFLCPLFTLRYRCIFLFTESTLTGFQRSISNITIKASWWMGG